MFKCVERVPQSWRLSERAISKLVFNVEWECDLWLHRVGVAGPEGFGYAETRLADIKMWSTATASTASVTSQTALREWLGECLCEVMQCGELL